MTLDEAIKHCLEVAEQNETSAITYKNCKEIKANMYEKLTAEKAENDCRECAADHRQLAEWLRELRELRLTNGAIKLGNMKEALYEIKELKEELEGWQNNPFEIITDICKQCTDCHDCGWNECCPFSRYREDYGKYPCFPDAWEDENG